jgi:hypothetical protein
MQMRVPGLYFIDNLEDVEQLLGDLSISEMSVYRLSSMISTRKELFEAVKTILPLDPPVVGTRRWDALSDSLWYGLVQLPENRICIVWPNCSLMEEKQPEEFEIAKSVFSDLCASLADPELTVGNSKYLVVLCLR